MAMAPLKLYDASGKLKGTVATLDDHSTFRPILESSDYYAIDKEDFLKKIEAGHAWDAEARGFKFLYSNDRSTTLPPLFFTVQTPPDALETLPTLPYYLMDGAFLVADERRDGRVKVANAHNVLVTSDGVIGGHIMDEHWIVTAPGRYKVVSVGDILCTKEYKFANPDVVWPKHKAHHAMNGQNVDYQDLHAAIAGGPQVTLVTKAGALRCLWETLGGGKVDKLAPGHKGIYLNAAITGPYQLAFLVATGYKLFSRIFAGNRRKDFFAVKGS